MLETLISDAGFDLSIKKIKAFWQNGFTTMRDLLYYFPRDWVVVTPKQIVDLHSGETARVMGQVRLHSINDSGKGLTRQTWTIEQGNATVKCTRFYNHSYYTQSKWRSEQQSQFQPETTVVVTGKVKVTEQWGIELVDPEFQVVGSDFVPKRTIEPIYSEHNGISPRDFAEILEQAVEWLADQSLAQACDGGIIDPLPSRQIDLKTVLMQIHRPKDETYLAKARERLAFDELFYLQLALLKRRQERQQQQVRIERRHDRGRIEKLLAQLPFDLTNAQKRVAREILTDMKQSAAMNRLVQGDVGSGKTLIAAIVLVAMSDTHQTALMAPTEVLAEQHYQKIRGWFEPLGIEVGLLTGSTKAKERNYIEQGLKNGSLRVVIGTHAIVQPNIQFQNLGLCIIDEQHRFGVEQRDALSQKGSHPHVLNMTATPIPRTLALTLHGDLDVSIIDELPPGRTPIVTEICTMKQAMKKAEKEIAESRQAYLIYPLVEESEKVDLQAAVEAHAELQATYPHWKIGLCHGRMSATEKQDAIDRFRQGQSQILVSTVVIEVGIDVPNATVMIIQNAERFGLAQLHQLRGRVGRGSQQSYCYLVPEKRSKKAMTRLEVLEQSNDGNVIAEMDLRIRGAGEVLGKRQAGIENFAIADVTQDIELLEQARNLAAQVIQSELSTAILEELKSRYP